MSWGTATKSAKNTREVEIDLSVVIPVFNEAANVGPLMAELAATLAAIEYPHPGPLPGGEGEEAWEVIWVDDGSSDGTREELVRLGARHPEARALALPEHRGQSAALWAGLMAARGQTIVTLDGDGQNDPADIPRLLAALESADLVVGCRRQRRDPLARRLFAAAANAARNLLTGSRLPDSGCGLKAMRREVLACLLPFDGVHRFLPTLAEIGGWRVRSLDVHHRPRARGRSKYGVWGRLIGPLLDCLMLRRLARRQLGHVAAQELRAAEAPRPALVAAAYERD